MEQGNSHQQALNDLAGLLAREHGRFLAERAARERAEREAAELAEQLTTEKRRADDAERRAGAAINQWLYGPQGASRRTRRLPRGR
jgi:2-oxo-4-hydroxy-4-carboxy--5-ureidoimidazoline (OHCU) decarboxylase